MALLFALLVTVGLALSLLSWLAQGRLLARPARRPLSAPPVSILKPLKGADPALASNLGTFFRLEYPEYELIFSVAEADDPAVKVVQRLLDTRPGFPARLVVSDRRVGLNPKVNNLANAEAAARHDVLLISDSNVAVAHDYLEDLVGHLAGAELVTSLIRGSGELGLGGKLEALQLNTFVMSGVAAWATVFRQPCVVGKSMLLRRNTLQRLGGWKFLGRFLAEDQVCGEEVVARGGRIAVSGQPVDNRLGRLSLSDFIARHLRWARIRRRLTLAGYAGELLLNPVGVALLALAVAPSGAAVATLAGALGAMSLLAFSAERRLGIRRGPLETLGLEALRSLLVLLAWPLPFLGTRVTWRGNRLRIARRTELVDLEAQPEAPLTEPALEQAT